MLGFARALGDYGATLMVAGARINGTSTGSIYVMDEMLGGHDVFPMAAAMTVFGIAMLYLANKLSRRFYHRA